MAQQDEMFRLIEDWKNSNLTKTDFLKGKNTSKDKFGYWLNKYHKLNGKKFIKQTVEPEFREMVFPDITPKGFQKVIELTTPSGIQIKIYG